MSAADHESRTMPEPLSETVRIARDLIQIDTTNWGSGTSRGEREAADYVAAFLRGLDLKPQIFESEPGRASLVCTVPGEDETLRPLVLHGHLDVVPAETEKWSVDPFAGEIRNGLLWGRGAVDMKNMDAMMLTSVAELLREGKRPRRGVILTFFADEENGGEYGSEYMVREHPELFAGAEAAVSEVGGYSVHFGDQRAYLVQVGEKGMCWARIRARGVAEHGSRVATDNPVVTLAEAVARLGRHEWPIELGATTQALLREVEALTGPGHPEELLERSGTGAGFLIPSIRTTTNPTVLEAGYKSNVIPDTAEAIIDIRILPGKHEATIREVRDILGQQIEFEVLASGEGVEVPFETDIVRAMHESLRSEDPDALILPYLLSGGTDNKALSKLGIPGYGFAPLQLPPELDFPGMFHGVDERVPLTAIDFGHRVLKDFLQRF